MKRLTSILLLIVFTYSFLGAGFVYNIWLYSIKKEVKQKLKKELPEESAIIKVPASWEESPPKQFEWHEEHEFRYRGQMYDVIKKERYGNQIWYYCHWDKAETKLLSNLAHYVDNYLQQKPHQQKTKTLLSNFLDKTFLAAGHTAFSLNPMPFNFVPLQDETAQSPFVEVKSPPPRYTMQV
ncbi:MAG: hypothetical protein U5K69_22850 [Balneolaceae bacterium]|nr:hypothetical protein [Balneolaceae bacterium]